MAATVDYDAPRRRTIEEEGTVADPLADLAAELKPVPADGDDPGELAESFELPGADISGEEFTVTVVPKQDDEFTCTRCFLVTHRHRLGFARGAETVCADCA
ncbi:DUF4193 family protein [Mycolicibacterium sp. Y3]